MNNLITINNVHNKGIIASSKINKLIHFVHACDGHSKSLSLNDNEFAIISMTWSIDSMYNFTYLIPYKDRILLCLENNQDVEAAIKFNIPFILCPMSVFINTTIFNLQNSNKIYNAILNSRRVEFKRRHLVLDVEYPVAIVADYKNVTYKSTFDNLEFPNGILLNKSNDKIRALQSKEVADVLHKSKVGLILSESEGNPKAVMEYLLCGLPVVTTKIKRCGRMMFLNDSNCIVVEPTKEAVTEGVKIAIAKIESGEFNKLNISENAKKQLLELRTNLQAAVSKFDPEFILQFS
jgi:hypothetical protein